MATANRALWENVELTAESYQQYINVYFGVSPTSLHILTTAETYVAPETNSPTSNCESQRSELQPRRDRRVQVCVEGWKGKA